MTDMVERVAEKIADAYKLHGRSFLEMSRAAIAAMMEPTPEQIQAGRDAPLAGQDDEDAPEDYRTVYRAMINAALGMENMNDRNANRN